MLGGVERWRATTLSVASLWVLAAVFAQPAGAVERVQDGGFEAATCTAANCVSPSWVEIPTSGLGLIGPVCSATQPAGPAKDACATLGSGYTTVPNWARLGATTFGGPSTTTAVEQPVAIPAAPARLAFNLRILNVTFSPVAHGTFAVKIGGTPVFGATDTTPGFANYARVTVDVSAFAGGTRLLRLEGTTTQEPGFITDSFDVDDVSLDAADARPPAPAPAAGGGGAVLPLARPTVSGFDFSPNVVALGAAFTPVSAVRKGGRFTYTLSVPAAVRIKLRRRLPGRRRAGRCVRPRPGLHRRCVRYQSKGTLRRNGTRGKNTTRFSGRVGSKALPPGSYRATITATNSAGTSTARTTSFRIVRRR